QLAVSPDGKWLFGACGREKPVLKWDAISGTEVGRFTTPQGHARGVVVEPTTGDVITSDGPLLYRLDPATMTPRGPGVGPLPEHAGRLAFAAGGRVLVVAGVDQVSLVDPATLRPTARLIDPDLRRSAHEGIIVTVAVHPAGAFVA